MDVGGQGQVRVNRCRLGDASTLMAENFTNPWYRVAQVEFLGKFGVQHNKRRRPSSFYCVAYEGGDDTLVPLTRFIRQISEFLERTLGALSFDFDSIARTLVIC